MHDVYFIFQSSVFSLIISIELYTPSLPVTLASCSWYQSPCSISQCTNYHFCAGIFKLSMVARNRVVTGLSYRPARGGIYKLLRSPGIDSKEQIPPAYVAWRAGTATLFLLGSWPPKIVLKFQLRLQVHKLAELVPWNRFLGSLSV